jgi:hypothetical protein
MKHARKQAKTKEEHTLERESYEPVAFMIHYFPLNSNLWLKFKRLTILGTTENIKQGHSLSETPSMWELFFSFPVCLMNLCSFLQKQTNNKKNIEQLEPSLIVSRM